jgi:BlaI family penicillinase repressor
MSFRAKFKKLSNASTRISDAEWTVMKAIWSLKTATARQVVEALSGDTAWKPKTIHTLLSRLVHKGILASEKPAREYVFTPRATEQECRLAASRSFLTRVFDGEIAPFVACFLEHKKLSRKEIDELKKLLEEAS